MGEVHRATERLRQRQRSITASVRAAQRPNTPDPAANPDPEPGAPGRGDPVRQRLDFTAASAGPPGDKGPRSGADGGVPERGQRFAGVCACPASPLLPRARSVDLGSGSARAAVGAPPLLRASAAAGSGSGLGPRQGAEASGDAPRPPSPMQRRLSELGSRGARALGTLSRSQTAVPETLPSPQRRRATRQHSQENLPSVHTLGPTSNITNPSSPAAASSPARRRRPAELVVPDAAAAVAEPGRTPGGGGTPGTRRALGDVTRSFNAPPSPLTNAAVRMVAFRGWRTSFLRFWVFGNIHCLARAHTRCTYR